MTVKSLYEKFLRLILYSKDFFDATIFAASKPVVLSCVAKNLFLGIVDLQRSTSTSLRWNIPTDAT